MLADRFAAARAGASRSPSSWSSLVWCIVAGRAAAVDPGDARPALDRPRRPGCWLCSRRFRWRSGLPFPLGPGARRPGGLAALGLGAERRLLCGRDATRQPDCARGRLQPGSALRRVLYGVALVTFPAARKSPRGRHIRHDHAPRSDLRRRRAVPGAARRAPRRGLDARRLRDRRCSAPGRPVSLTDAQFDAIQKRKPAAMKRIEAYLKDASRRRRSGGDGGVRGGAARVFPLHLLRAPRDARRCLRGRRRSPGGWAMAPRCRTISARPT